jgi:DNA-binding transcriptional MerR regulator
MDFGHDLMLAADAARVIGCSPSAVVLYADSGRLPMLGRTVRGVRVFSRDDVERFRARFTRDFSSGKACRPQAT